MTMTFRHVWLLAGVVLVAAPLAAQEQSRERPKVEFKKLKFMAGCWEGQLDRDTKVEEIWTEPAENLLLATTRYIGKKNRATSFEFSKIEATDTAVVFAASSEGKPFDTYVLTKIVDEYVEFENLTKSFPQRIIYRLSADGSLIPRNEGDGRPSVEVRLKKFTCPGS